MFANEGTISKGEALFRPGWIPKLELGGLKAVSVSVSTSLSERIQPRTVIRKGKILENVSLTDRAQQALEKYVVSFDRVIGEGAVSIPRYKTCFPIQNVGRKKQL